MNEDKQLGTPGGCEAISCTGGYPSGWRAAFDVGSLVIWPLSLLDRQQPVDRIGGHAYVCGGILGGSSPDRGAFQASAGAISGPSERSALDADGAGGIRGSAAERGPTAGASTREDNDDRHAFDESSGTGGDEAAGSDARVGRFGVTRPPLGPVERPAAETVTRITIHVPGCISTSAANRLAGSPRC